MLTTSLRKKMMNSIRELPDDPSIDDAMERLLLLYKIEKGLDQTKSGLTVSHDEAKTE